MIVGLFTDLIPVGGVQLAGRHTAAVLARLAAEPKWETQFLSLNDATGEHELNVAGVAVRFTGFGRSKRRFAARAIGLARNARIVVAGHPHLAVPASAMKARSKNFCLVVQSHGIEVWKPMSTLRSVCLRRSDIVTAPSRYTAEKLREIQRLPESKIRICPWGLDPGFLELAARAPQFSLPSGIPNSGFVLAVGRWASAERYKGFDTLIRVLPALLRETPDLQLVFIGDGDDRPSLEALAKAARVHERVHFVSGISREQLVACYAGAEFFALPSSGEGFGLVFLEAMSMGKAVVGGNHGGIPDIIEEGITGFLVAHGDEEQLSAKLSLLLRDRALREDMGRRGRDRVMQKFTFGHFEAQLREILANVCDK
jgi:phosphatidyl-myo-inositol dimannoside synthase